MENCILLILTLSAVLIICLEPTFNPVISSGAIDILLSPSNGFPAIVTACPFTVANFVAWAANPDMLPPIRLWKV